MPLVEEPAWRQLRNLYHRLIDELCEAGDVILPQKVERGRVVVMGTPLSNDHRVSAKRSRIVTGAQQIAQRLLTPLCRLAGLPAEALGMEAITPQQLGDEIQGARIEGEIQDVPGIIENDLAPLHRWHQPCRHSGGT